MIKIVIIGGGTAGWLTGLYFNKIGYPDITIIESSRIGILGAGEGTSPSFAGFLERVEIDENDFLKNTGATIKVANDFINWSQYGGKYSHGFLPVSEFLKDDEKNIHGYHFDARECAKYFKKIGIDRGINHLDVNITKFTQDGKGDIKQIHTEEKIDIDVDFVIDCSGFSRLCIGKLYNGKWRSYSDYLKVNSAIAYFLPQENKLIQKSKTHTQSIAMNSGWMWQAPLKHRWGCGYVFNDTYVTIEEAKEEVENYLNRKIEIVKTFKFDAGGYEKTWINNCVALGLASGFLEPLEATSLMTLILSIEKLAKIGLTNLEEQDYYNNYVNNINYQSMLFVCHHYNCGRTDTKFWNDVNDLKLPPELAMAIDNLKIIKNNSDLSRYIKYEGKSPVFGIYNYKAVDLGHKTKTGKTLV